MVPRGLAQDHAAKRAAIRSGVARYFAAEGYHFASMAGAARACGVSKALIYHYYDSKDALLFDILATHLGELADRVAAVPAGPPEARLRAMLRTILDAYRDADAEHKLQADALAALPPASQAPLIAAQRRIVAAMEAALAAVAPGLAGSERLRPVAMSVFGMVNWFYMWHRPGRGIHRGVYADLVADLVLDGVRGTVRPPSPRRA